MVEQQHIADAFVFELSKVERPDIRVRMVSNLLNVDQGLADAVADGLGLDESVTPSTPARPPITDLPESPALSILRNPPGSIEGRKVGILVTDGTDAKTLTALLAAVQAAGATTELVAPKVGGVTTSDGKRVAAKQKIDGGPSVLYDAVAVLVSDSTVAALTRNAAATDFVSDAYAHCKFIAFVASAVPLLEAGGVRPDEEGLVAVDETGGVDAFVSSAADLRVWAREALVHQT
jgi:catalase